MEKGLVVEKQSLFFLLRCRGCSRCPSLFEPEVQEEPRKILETLFGKGQIENTGDHFRVSGPLAAAVDQIADADSVACLYHGCREKELLYLYPGEKILAVQEMFCRKQALRLIFLEKDHLKEFLEEQELLGECGGWDPLPFTDEGLPPLPERLGRRAELGNYPWIRLLARMTDNDTGYAGIQIGIVRNGLTEEILAENMENGSVEQEPYTADRFLDRLLARWKGGWKGK